MIFKNICLIIFIAITILFTVGYSALPIIKGNTTVSSNPGTADTSVSTIFYFTHLTNLINDAKDAYSKIDYSSVGGIATTIFNTLFYSCIGITVLLTVGILLAFFGMKIISKIVFCITLIIMIIIIIMILLLITKNALVGVIPSVITNLIPTIPGLPTNMTANTNITYDNGYLLMSAATVLMSINYTIYTIFA